MAIPEHVKHSPCPLCGRTKPMRRSAKKLYGGYACKKCVYAFTNRRQFAYIIDAVAFFFLIMGISYLLLFVGIDVDWPAEALFASSLPIVVSITLMILYQNLIGLPFYFKDGFRGRSPGKWLMGVTVVDEETYEPTDAIRSFKRNILLLIPFAALVVAFQMSKGKRYGDGLAKTRVIWDKYRHRFPFDNRGYVCRQCGYDLRGNVSGRCSECGTSVPATTPASPAPMAVPVVRPVD